VGTTNSENIFQIVIPFYLFISSSYHYRKLAIHAPLGRSWLVRDTSLGPTAQGWGAEQEQSGRELDFPEWRRVGAEQIKDLIHSFHMQKMH